MKKLFACAAVALSFFAITSAAHAVPIQWTVSGGAFDDGGTVSGSFVYDADTEVYSNVRLTTTTGTKGDGAEFRTKCTTAHCMTALTDFTEILFIASANQSDLTGVPLLDMEPSSPLTNTPETVDLEFISSYRCPNAVCTYASNSDLRMAFGAQLVGEPYIAPPATPTNVPTISQWGLMLLSLLLAAAALLHSRRKT